MNFCFEKANKVLATLMVGGRAPSFLRPAAANIQYPGSLWHFLLLLARIRAGFFGARATFWPRAALWPRGIIWASGSYRRPETSPRTRAEYWPRLACARRINPIYVARRLPGGVLSHNVLYRNKAELGTWRLWGHTLLAPPRPPARNLLLNGILRKNRLRATRQPPPGRR